MGPYYVERLHRPYDYRALIEAYIYSKRAFVHADFATYYAGLLAALEKPFGVRLAREGLTFTQSVLWNLFESTVRSLLRVGTPWDCYLEASLIDKTLKENGAPGEAVMRASRVISQAAKASEAAHRDMLQALFVAIFGATDRIVTSAELRAAGFDDSREPDIVHYYDYM
jgi:hypothetical protein